MTAQTQRAEILDDPPQRLESEEDIKRLLEEQSFCAA
jgi:hypothetical protein